MPTEDDDGLNWTSDIINDADFEEMINTSNDIIANEAKVFNFHLELTIQEAINTVKKWKCAFFDDDVEMMDEFIGAIAGYMAFLENALGDMGIDVDDEEE